jgi:hypothetical protein
MRYLRKFYVLFVALPLVVIFGCVATSGTVRDDSSPNTSAQQSDPNFIPAPGLNIEKFNKLWNIATTKCYDFGYSVTNNDKATKNIICTTQSGGDTMTLRVRFADEGIYVNLQSSSAAWALLGKGMGPKTKEHKEMKAALIAGLK